MTRSGGAAAVSSPTRSPLSSAAADNAAVTTSQSSKRHADMNGETLGAPRAKRRFDERMSAAFSLFHINDGLPVGNVRGDLGDDLSSALDSPSSEEDDDMEDDVAPSFVDEEDSLDDTPIKRIRLDEKLQEYLKMAREAPILPQKRENTMQVALWQPNSISRPLADPFLDPLMKGRICEVEASEVFSENEPSVEGEVEEPDEDEDFETLPETTDSSPLIVEQLTDYEEMGEDFMETE